MLQLQVQRDSNDKETSDLGILFLAGVQFIVIIFFAKSGGCPTYSFADSNRPMSLRSNHAPSPSANVPRPICTPLRLQVYLIVVHLVADIVKLTRRNDETVVEKVRLRSHLCKIL